MTRVLRGQSALGELNGEIAVVTGARQGQGAEHVRRLLSAGAKVVAIDVQPPVEETSSADDDILKLQADVSDEADWRRVVECAEQTFGPISILVNNAAVHHSSPLLATDLDAWRRILEVNLTGTFLGIKHVGPSMRRNGRGAIVNISSIAGLKGHAGLGAYAASKWAVRGLTKVAALELARDNIRVNSVHPGLIRTPMAADVPNEQAAVQPIDRWGTVDDVANMVMFLVSSASGFCTGSEFVVDGGITTGTVQVRAG